MSLQSANECRSHIVQQNIYLSFCMSVHEKKYYHRARETFEPLTTLGRVRWAPGLSMGDLRSESGRNGLLRQYGGLAPMSQASGM